jgi:hypothetical protein
MLLDARIMYYCQNVHLLAIFGRPNCDINISCPGEHHLCRIYHLSHALESGVLDIYAYQPEKKHSSKRRLAEEYVAQTVADTVLQTSQTIFHQLNFSSYQWQFGRRDTRSMPMILREPYVWAQWHVSLPPLRSHSIHLQ